MTKSYDLVSMGRSSLDLYSNDIGAAFTDIKTFASFVGGCPTNIAVGARRLGLNTALLTAVGADPVGDFLLKFLKQEGVDTSFIPRKAQARTSCVVLGIEPPDKFPLVFYRDNCADIQLNIDDVISAPIKESRTLLVSGTGLSREPSRSATIHAMEIARASGTAVFLDLDFRADQWTSSEAQDVRAYGVTIRSVLHLVDIVLGTEDEIKAACMSDAGKVSIKDFQISGAAVAGNTEQSIALIQSNQAPSGPKALVMKRGDKGAIVFADGKQYAAPAFKIEVCNVLGAGDAFAAGFIYGYVKNLGWEKSAEMGNAAGAIVVTRQGCANFMPFENELKEFICAQRVSMGV